MKTVQLFNYSTVLRKWQCIECGVPQPDERRLWGEPDYHRIRCATRKYAAQAIKEAIEVTKRMNQLTEAPLTIIKRRRNSNGS